MTWLHVRWAVVCVCGVMHWCHNPWSKQTCHHKKNSWHVESFVVNRLHQVIQLLFTTSSNLWEPKERILYNFFLQQVPTYDNPKKEFFTTFSYNKFQLMTTQRKNSSQLLQVTTSYNLWRQPKERISLQLLQVTTYVKPWNFVGFVCGVWESCSY
jgi:hypothetical protein